MFVPYDVAQPGLRLKWRQREWTGDQSVEVFGDRNTGENCPCAISAGRDRRDVFVTSQRDGW